MPEGVGTALRLSYPRSEPTCGAAPIEGIIMSRSSCRNWSFPEVGAPARSAALVPEASTAGRICGRSNVFGLIYGALLHDLRVSDSQCTSLPATPLTTLQHAYQGPMQPTCSGQIGPKTVN